MENIQSYNPDNEQQTCFFNGAEQSPESLIKKATEGKIGFLDLYSYHIDNPNQKEEEFAEKNPHEKIINIGTEFNGQGSCFNYFYFINNDALNFMHRVKNNSVQTINIDFPLFDKNFIRGRLTDEEISHLNEAKRILEPNGKLYMILSLCHDKNQKEKVKKQIKQIGYKEIIFLETNNYLEGNKHNCGYDKLVPIIATK